MFVDFRTELVEGSSKRAGEELEQESTKKQKVDEDKDTAELQILMEVIPDEEEVAIDVVPLSTKSPSIVDWKIHKEIKKSNYQIVRADGKSQMYRVFSQMLKSFTREDLEDLYKLVNAKYGSTRLVEDLDLVLWNDLKTILRINEVFGSIILVIMELLTEKLDNFGDKYQVQGRIVGIKSLLNAASIVAALINVNVAQSKLVLLENFNEYYSKCLRLLYKVNATEGVNAASEEVSTAKLVSTAYVILESSTSVRRPQSKDIKLKNRILKNTNDKSSSAHVRKVSSSVRIDSSKRETMNSTVCQSNTSVLNTKTVNAVNDGSNIVCVSCGKDVFMLSHEKCVARYALSIDTRVKRALFTTPVVAKSKKLGATSVVTKSRLSVAKTLTATNKVSSALSLSPDSSQSRTLSIYMKNKIATSQK
ncbi:hypothetical protein Tco_1525187 [Tanacetum coccineum]